MSKDSSTKQSAKQSDKKRDSKTHRKRDRSKSPVSKKASVTKQTPRWQSGNTLASHL